MSSLLEMMHVLSLQFLFIPLIQMSHDWQQCLGFFSFQRLGRLPNILRTIVQKMSKFEVTSKSPTKTLEGIQDASVIN